MGFAEIARLKTFEEAVAYKEGFSEAETCSSVSPSALGIYREKDMWVVYIG